VHYSADWRNSPPLAIQVTSRGGVDEHVVWETFASIPVGASLFLVTPVVPFHDDLHLASHVVIERDGRVRREADLEIEARVRHHVFWSANQHPWEASEQAFRVLARRIAEELAAASP
jgi:hypothetical protein